MLARSARFSARFVAPMFLLAALAWPGGAAASPLPGQAWVHPHIVAAPSATPLAPLPSGRVILVSRARQWLYAYENGALVFANGVETGRPELPTPAGRFSVLLKARNLTFTSPWPAGSPFHYNPTHINYALLFKQGGFYLHDAWWHATFGPGANTPHRVPGGGWETGSHGCVGMALADAERLYAWARVGTLAHGESQMAR